MFRRTTGRRWRSRDIRGVPYEPVDHEAQDASARTPPPGTPVCPECGQPRPDDAQVKAGMSCEVCGS